MPHPFVSSFLALFSAICFGDNIIIAYFFISYNPVLWVVCKLVFCTTDGLGFCRLQRNPVFSIESSFFCFIFTLTSYTIFFLNCYCWRKTSRLHASVYFFCAANTGNYKTNFKSLFQFIGSMFVHFSPRGSV